MEIANFTAIQDEFMRRVSAAVYCIMATVDRQNRPRTRVIHPIWEGSTGWLISWPQSHKAKHLAHNPHVSLAYLHNKAKPVYAECVAEWITDRVEQQRAWELHQRIPPPLGFDPEPHYGTIDHHYFGVLCFTPWRIELGNLGGESIIWREPNGAY
jgi:general stress protein 26